MSRRVVIAALFVTSLALGGCGDEEPVPQVPMLRPATVNDLVGPWQATPFLLDPALRARIEQACRRDIEMPPGSVAAVVDVRGASVATIRMTGQTPGSCDALEVTNRGEAVGAGGGWRQDQPEPLPPIGPRELGGIERQTVQGGSLTVKGWSVYGRVGNAVRIVGVEPQNGPPLVATLENGWFAAWWPVQPGDPNMDEGRQPRVLVRAYDAFGATLDEAISE